jgi:hypothetical protein
MKRLNLLLLFLSFSLLLGGCSDSSNPGDSSIPTASSNQTRIITASLPNTYLTTTDQSVALPVEKSCVIITAGFDHSLKLLFQQYTFTKTGSPIKIEISDIKNATYLSFVTEISLDQTFTDPTTWSYVPRTNIIMASALRDLINGTKTCYFDSNITEVKFAKIITPKSKSSFTTDIKTMINYYCNQLNINLSQQL